MLFAYEYNKCVRIVCWREKVTPYHTRIIMRNPRFQIRESAITEREIHAGGNRWVKIFNPIPVRYGEGRGEAYLFSSFFLRLRYRSLMRCTMVGGVQE